MYEKIRRGKLTWLTFTNRFDIINRSERKSPPCAHKRALCLFRFRVPSGYRLRLKLQMLMIVFVSSGMSHRLVRVQWSLLS